MLLQKNVTRGKLILFSGFDRRSGSLSRPQVDEMAELANTCALTGSVTPLFVVLHRM